MHQTNADHTRMGTRSRCPHQDGNVIKLSPSDGNGRDHIVSTEMATISHCPHLDGNRITLSAPGWNRDCIVPIRMEIWFHFLPPGWKQDCIVPTRMETGLHCSNQDRNGSNWIVSTRMEMGLHCSNQDGNGIALFHQEGNKIALSSPGWIRDSIFTTRIETRLHYPHQDGNLTIKQQCRLSIILEKHFISFIILAFVHRRTDGHSRTRSNSKHLEHK